jgi:hypothetical protein
MSRVRIVTAYERLDGARSHEEYVRLGNRLLRCGVPTIFFSYLWHEFDWAQDHVDAQCGMEGYWLRRLTRPSFTLPRIPFTDNPKKDTREFHDLQHQKTAWLAQAAADDPRDVLVWVDLGIFHVPGITEAGIRSLAGRAAKLPQDKVTFASIWGEPIRGILVDRVEWWCAGGVVICPGRLAGDFHAEAMDAAEKCWRDYGRITYEVNTWAAAWRRKPSLFRHYLCDHNQTILEAA